jgi:hypothetical protein
MAMAYNQDGNYTFEGNIGIGPIVNNSWPLQVKGSSGIFSVKYTDDVQIFSVTEDYVKVCHEGRGSVGIGTGSPGDYHYSPLVTYRAQANYITIASDADGTTSILFSDGTTDSEKYEGQLEYVHSSNEFRMYTNHTKAMTIDDSQNVGIGTESPAGKLEVAGSGHAILLTDSGDSYNKRVEIGESAGNGGYIDIFDDAEGSKVKFRTYGDSYFTGGNVGIGTTAPGYNLEVAGTFYSAGSSIDYKKHVTDLDVDSSLIHSLRPVSYNYKKEYKDFGYNVKEGKQIGLVSEEVAETIPELAIMKDGRPKNVDYQKLAVVLLAEVQSLKKDIEELKKDN